MIMREELRWKELAARPFRACFALLITGLAAFAFAPQTRAETSDELIQKLRTVEANDKSNQMSAKVAKQIRAQKDVNLLSVLKAMNGATPLGRNWLLGVANSIYQQSGASQTAELKAFLADTAQNDEARYTVFHWLSKNDEAMRKSMLASMREDPSQELRYLAVKDAIDAKPSTPELESLLQAARHPEQVTGIIESLKEAGVVVDQAKHFGFLMDWKLIGPFDHVGTANFDKVFPVEADAIAQSEKAEYDGKNGKVSWISKSTENVQGELDLAEVFANEKGCIVYALAEFDSPTETEAELRLGCINGNKAWLNGKLIMSNEVYHTSMQIDQYVERVTLKAGKNRILLKLCQNEQKEQWAQRFAFQLRVSDFTGKAILAKGR